MMKHLEPLKRLRSAICLSFLSEIEPVMRERKTENVRSPHISFCRHGSFDLYSSASTDTLSYLSNWIPRILLVLMLLIFGAGRGQASVALVQHKSVDAGTTTSATLAFTSNKSAGNWIAVCIRAGASGETFTVTDSKGNTYHKAIQFNETGNGNTLGIFYAENIAGGANSISVADTTSATLRFAIFEYSGIALSGSLDEEAAAQGTSTAPNSGNFTTTANGDLLLGAVLTGGTATFTGGSGYTIEESVPAEPNTKLIAEDQVQTSAGAASASASLAVSDHWAAALAAFKVAPQITSVSPTSGTPGTLVTITGNSFAPTLGSSTVTFNGTTVTPTSWSATSIVAPAPSGATTGNVVVTVSGIPSNGTSFTVLPGGIHLVQHASKDAGSTTSSSLGFNSNNTPGNWIGVCIRAGHSGEAFTITDSKGNTYHQAVQLNMTVDTPNGDTVGIYYAENIMAGANTVTVSDTTSATLRFAILEYSGVTISNSLDVTASAQGTSASPNSGNATSTVSGDLLLGAMATANAANYTPGNGYATVESVPAEPNSKLSVQDQIQANSGTASSSASLAESDQWGAIVAGFKGAGGGGAAPSIASLSPTSGAVGASVTISGSNFGTTQGASTVTFNGTGGSLASWSATSIVVPVPSGATTGNVVVTVSGVASNGAAFTVMSTPSITSLSPTSGAVGTSVTVTGTNFGTTQGASTVTFNGTTGTPTSWSATSVVVPVPLAAITGPVVAVVGGTASNSVVFTVTAPALQISTPTSGAVVSPGQSLNVSVISPANITFTNSSVIGEAPIGFVGTAPSVPTQFTLSVPSNAPAGPYQIRAFGITGTVLVPSPSVTIDVERPDLPTSLRLAPASIVLDAPGQSIPLAVTASYSDGTILLLTKSSQLTYITSNPAIATVDSSGAVTAVAAGTAYITAMDSIASQYVKAAIEVDVLPPAIAVSAASLSFPPQTVGTTSTAQQLTLTNASNSPMNILQVTTMGDFTQSNTCISSSPLGPGASCIVSISYTAGVVGAENGSLKITNDVNGVPTAILLSGSGM
jgi:hypothetical protein